MGFLPILLYILVFMDGENQYKSINTITKFMGGRLLKSREATPLLRRVTKNSLVIGG